jgi:hypothetical protein
VIADPVVFEGCVVDALVSRRPCGIRAVVKAIRVRPAEYFYAKFCGGRVNL